MPPKEYAAVPDQLRERDQWLLWSEGSSPPKRPLNADGYGASWNDPSEWLPFEEAVELARDVPMFDGVGFVISEGDPYVGIDLDGCLREPFAPKPKQWLPPLDDFEGTYIEYSTSGTGLHPFIEADALPSWWADVHFDDEEHEGVEAYTSKFFIVTGQPLDELAGPSIEAVDPAPFLRAAYEAITGSPPDLPGAGDRPAHDLDREADLGIYDVISRASYPEGENTSHPYHSSQTGTNFQVDPGGETFRCWRHDVTGNAYHLLGIEQGVISCGEWASGGLKGSTWRDIFDAARETGYDVPGGPEQRAAANGGVAVASSASEAQGPEAADGPPEPGGGRSGDAPAWSKVRRLFESDVPGSTTKGYGAAASILCERDDFVAIRETGELYYYHDGRGFYVRNGATHVEEIVEREIPEHANSNRVRNIRQKVRARSYKDLSEFSPPEGMVNVRNGVIDLKKWGRDPMDALEAHSPDYFFTAQLDARYDPEADDDGFLEASLEIAVPNRPERRKLLEFVGHALEMWTTDMEKCMTFVGPPQSGKSSIQECIEKLFGSMPTVTALSPHQIADSRFDAATLRDAALNTVNDINGGKIQNTGKFKRTISGQTTKLEDKHVRAQFGAPKAKHIWTCNWVPRFVGQDESVFRRLLIVEFENEIPRSERDEGHKKRLKNDEDVRSVLLNLALEGRARLRAQEGFTNDRPRDETRRLWDSWRNSNLRFLYEQCEVTGEEDDKVEKRVYWRAYQEWAARTGYERRANRAVTKDLEWIPDIGGTGGDSDFYTGLALKSEDAADVSQNARVSKLKRWIQDFETPTSGAAIEDVAKHAVEQGFEQDSVERDIQNLLKMGVISEVSSGVVRLN